LNEANDQSGVVLANLPAGPTERRIALVIGYEQFPRSVRESVVVRFPRVNYKQEIAMAFLGGFEHKTLTTEGTCNEDICSHFICNYRRSNFYGQIRDSSFPNAQ
jgi:hypothetical protein